jgi:thiol-disulfide isomerase/thioredoxin
MRLFSTVTLFFLLALPAWGGEVFPDLPLTGAVTPEQVEYLAPTGSELTPSSIGADFLLVEVFSMYCPICQRDAPMVNDLYERVNGSELGKRIRFIGIGAGNTPFEVEFYRKKYAVAFPLFDDPRYVYHKALGEVGTPAFYLVDRTRGLAVLLEHVGEIKNPDEFIARLEKLTTP